MVIVSTGGPVTESQVQELENTVAAPLPADYRTFLLSYNARQVRPCVLPTPNLPRSEKVALHELTCFCPKTACDFGYRLSVYADRIPKGMLPIGSDPGGNLFLLDLNPSSVGRVNFWERAGEADEGEEATMSNMYELAPTFTDFLSRLQHD